MTPLPPWRSPLARALHRNRSLPHLRFVQLATVDFQGRPHNRTVVYRGLVEETHQMQFVTDRRSEKIDHLLHNPWVEVCWYFTKTREQIRFRGTMQIIQIASALRQTAWERLSPQAKAQFCWPAPGALRSPDSSLEAPPILPHPPDTFCLLLLSVEQVDHLELRGEPQNRWIHHQVAGQWQTQAVNP